jgi:hypothetical protein
MDQDARFGGEGSYIAKYTLTPLEGGERGRNRTFNLLIKSHVGLSIHFLATHN